MEKKPEEIVQFNLRLPIELRLKLRAIAGAENKSMTQLVVEILTKYLK